MQYCISAYVRIIDCWVKKILGSTVHASIESLMMSYCLVSKFFSPCLSDTSNAFLCCVCLSGEYEVSFGTRSFKHSLQNHAHIMKKNYALGTYERSKIYHLYGTSMLYAIHILKIGVTFVVGGCPKFICRN